MVLLASTFQPGSLDLQLGRAAEEEELKGFGASPSPSTSTLGAGLDGVDTEELHQHADEDFQQQEHALAHLQDGPSLQGEQMSHKRCSKCKETKLTAQFFKDPSRKQGFTSWCKACFSDYMQQKKLCPPVPVASRMCSICKQSKAADEFIRDARTSTGLDARCRECRRQQNLSKKAQHQAGAMQTLAEKQCKHCHMVKPASEFKRHFFTNTGLDSWCKACVAVRRNEKRQEASAAQQQQQQQQSPAAAGGMVQGLTSAAPVELMGLAPMHAGQAGAAAEPSAAFAPEVMRMPVQVPGPSQVTKRCSTCREVKAAADFTRDAGKKAGLGTRCRLCESQYRRMQRQKHKAAAPAGAGKPYAPTGSGPAEGLAAGLGSPGASTKGIPAPWADAGAWPAAPGMKLEAAMEAGFEQGEGAWPQPWPGQGMGLPSVRLQSIAMVPPLPASRSAVPPVAVAPLPLPLLLATSPGSQAGVSSPSDSTCSESQQLLQHSSPGSAPLPAAELPELQGVGGLAGGWRFTDMLMGDISPPADEVPAGIAAEALQPKQKKQRRSKQQASEEHLGELVDLPRPAGPVTALPAPGSRSGSAHGGAPVQLPPQPPPPPGLAAAATLEDVAGALPLVLPRRRPGRPTKQEVAARAALAAAVAAQASAGAAAGSSPAGSGLFGAGPLACGRRRQDPQLHYHNHQQQQQAAKLAQERQEEEHLGELVMQDMYGPYGRPGAALGVQEEEEDVAMELLGTIGWTDLEGADSFHFELPSHGPSATAPDAPGLLQAQHAAPQLVGCLQGQGVGTHLLPQGEQIGSLGHPPAFGQAVHVAAQHLPEPFGFGQAGRSEELGEHGGALLGSMGGVPGVLGALEHDESNGPLDFSELW